MTVDEWVEGGELYWRWSNLLGGAAVLQFERFEKPKVSHLCVEGRLRGLFCDSR